MADQHWRHQPWADELRGELRVWRRFYAFLMVATVIAGAWLVTLR